MAKGVFKRCGCRDPHTGKTLGGRCDRLGQRGHGSWAFRCRISGWSGRSEQIRRGGFKSQAAARRARDDVLAQSREQRTGANWTAARWLLYWLSCVRVKPSTLHSYTHHVTNYLIPALGRARLTDLTCAQLTAMFAEIAATPGPTGIIRSGGTLRLVHATLRAALNHAVREGLLDRNPAKGVVLPKGWRPYAVVWTEDLVQRWRETGWRPSVAVWTTEQLAEFLLFVASDVLYPMWWLIALRGLRRGEAAGLRWRDVDLDRSYLWIRSQRTTVGYRIIEGTPKSKRSQRIVALDKHTVAILKAHLRAQRQLYARWGKQPSPDDYVFVDSYLRPWHPSYLTHRLAFLIKLSGLPPVRLHDLRHGAGSVAQHAGADLKTVSEQLGHSSIVLTADTYLTILPVIQCKAAEATARLVVNTARRARAKMLAKAKPAGPVRPPEMPAPHTPASTKKRRKTAGKRASKRRRKGEQRQS